MSGATTPKPLVTITGITGFIGSHVCQQFLEDGTYQVRGTVRNKSDASKLEPLKAAFGDEAFGRLEVVEADLLDGKSLASAVAGSSYVVHVASPFFYGASDDEMVKPALEGTTSIIEACAKAGKVKRLVITSSIAAVSNLSKANRPSDVCTMDESYWTEVDRPEGLSAYAKSKTLAERAAWDLHGKLEGSEKFELVTICPSAVMGPPIRKEGFQSGETAKKLLEGSFENIHNGTDAFVDVRDVADAHVRAVKVPEAAGRRFIVAAVTLKWVELANIMEKEFKSRGFKVHTNESDKVDPIITIYDNTASREVLGVKYRPMEETMVDMVNKMIEIGFVTVPSS